MTNSINNTDVTEERKLLGEYSERRLIDAEILIEMFSKLEMQANHFGKNSACPTCQCMIEVRKYYEKYVDLEKFKVEHAECIDEYLKNPRKFLMS